MRAFVTAGVAVAIAGVCGCDAGDPSELDGRSPAKSVGVPAQDAGCAPETTTSLAGRPSASPDASALGLPSHEFFEPAQPPPDLLVEDALDRGYLVVFYRPGATPEMVEHARTLDLAFAAMGSRQPFLIVPMSPGTPYSGGRAVVLVVRESAEEARQECDAISESRIRAFDSTNRTASGPR